MCILYCLCVVIALLHRFRWCALCVVVFVIVDGELLRCVLCVYVLELCCFFLFCVCARVTLCVVCVACCAFAVRIVVYCLCVVV